MIVSPIAGQKREEDMPKPRYIPFDSKSTPGKRTYQLLEFRGRYFCNCPGFDRKERGECPHTHDDRELRRLLKMTNTAVAIRDNTPQDIVPEGYKPVELRPPPPAERLPSPAQYDMMLKIASMAVEGANKAAPADRALPVNIKTPEQAMTIMLAGYELGMPIFTALRRLYMVNGRVELETQALMGLVKAGDPTAWFRFDEYTHNIVTVTLIRGGEEVITVSYTRDDAIASGQMRKPGPWQFFTRDMLAYSAVKRCCRLGAPELTNQIAPPVTDFQPYAIDVERAHGDELEAPTNPVTAALMSGEASPAEVFGSETAVAAQDRADSGASTTTAPKPARRAPAPRQAAPAPSAPTQDPDGKPDPRLVQRINDRMTLLKNGDSSQSPLEPTAYGTMYRKVIEVSMPEGATKLDFNAMTAAGAARAWDVVKPEEPPAPETDPGTVSSPSDEEEEKEPTLEPEETVATEPSEEEEPFE